MVSWDEKGAAVENDISSGLLNLGRGGGSWVGGIVCDKGAISYIGFVGAVFAVISVLFFAFVLLRKLRQSVN